MNGQDLYQLYIDANAENNCSVDSWDELSDEDKEVWEKMGAQVEKPER